MKEIDKPNSYTMIPSEDMIKKNKTNAINIIKTSSSIGNNIPPFFVISIYYMQSVHKKIG